MSSGCGGVLSLEDMKTAKKHHTFEAEVITGKAGGVAGGTDIDEATNPVTGQVQETLPAIMEGVTGGVNSQLSHQQQEFYAQMSAQMAEFKDMLAASGYSWLPDYVDGPVTFTNRSQVTVYNGVAYRLAASTPVGFTTTGTTSESWDNDKENLVAIGDNDIRQQVQYQLGQWLPDAISIFSLTTDYDAIRTRGFYAANDGGDGVWVKTGAVNLSLAGTHVVTEAKVYNANGVEYELSLVDNKIDLRANGAKEVTGKNALTTDGFVCTGQVFNGIASVFGYVYDDGKSSVVNNGKSTDHLKVMLGGGLYRIGKESMNARGGMSFDGENCTIAVYPHSDYTYAKTGIRLNGFSTLNNATYWRSNTTSWDLASWNYCSIENVHFIGDQVPSVTRDSCTAGVGLEIINPQHATIRNVTVHNFLVDCIAREYNAWIPSQYRLIHSDASYINKPDDSITSQQGHFYGINYLNCNFLGSRDATLINMCDWATWIGGNLFNQYNWIDGVDAVRPKYILLQLGSDWVLEGGQLGVYHDDTPSRGANYPYTFAPSEGVVYDICRQSKYGGKYAEWVKNLITIGAYGATYAKTAPTDGVLSNNQRYAGLQIAFDTNYKPDATSTLVKFSKEMFGAFSGNDQDGWTWTDGVKFSRGDVPRALSQFSIGTPVRDSGAFPYQGYDFKYGTLGVGFYGAKTPDVDSLRGTRDKAFLNDNGLIARDCTLMFSTLNPAYDSNIIIVYRDLTGKFDPTNFILNEYSYIQDSTMPNDYISKGNALFDYGNGWKAAVVRNLRPFGYSEERGWSPQNYLKAVIPRNTPIIFKTIQAYVGGVPIYPQALPEYSPRSQCNGMWGTQTSLTGCNLYPNDLGGGIFMPGDMVDGWNFVMKTGRWTTGQDVATYGYPSNRRAVSVSGTIGSYLSATTVSATITAKTDATTTIELSDADIVRVCMGIPIYIASSTGTVTPGKFNLSERLINTDGTLTNKYVVAASFGAVGDVLTIDNSLSVYDYQPTMISYVKTSGWANVGGTLTVGVWANIASYLTVGGSANFNANVNMNAGGITSGTIRPNAAGSTSIGAAGYPFKDGFFQNAITIVSDEDHKPIIESVPDAVLDIFDSLEIKRWKYDWAIEEKGEDGARWHVGFVAQEIVQAFTDAGLNAQDYAFIVWREWDAEPAQYEQVEVTPEQVDPVTGEVTASAVYEQRLVSEEAAAGARWELVPHEINFILEACTRRRLKKIEDSM